MQFSSSLQKLALILALPLVSAAGCATSPKPAPAPVIAPTDGVPEVVPNLQVWFTPIDRACPAFKTRRRCLKAVNKNVMDEQVRCVRRQGPSHMCAKR